MRNKSVLKRVKIQDASGKNVPVRKCVGCRSQKAKPDLIRIVREAKKREILIDKTYKIDGRGIYICKNLECIKKARKARAVERIFSRKIEDEFYDGLERMISEIE